MPAEFWNETQLLGRTNTSVGSKTLVAWVRTVKPLNSMEGWIWELNHFTACHKQISKSGLAVGHMTYVTLDLVQAGLD